MSPILVGSIFQKRISRKDSTAYVTWNMRAGQTYCMKSDSHIVCVVFRTDTVSYSDIILTVSAIKTAGPKWLGHLVRMEGNVPWGKTIPSRPESSGKKGGFRIRRPDSVYIELNSERRQHGGGIRWVEVSGAELSRRPRLTRGCNLRREEELWQGVQTA